MRETHRCTCGEYTRTDRAVCEYCGRRQPSPYSEPALGTDAKLDAWQAHDDAIRETITRLWPGDKARDIIGSIEQATSRLTVLEQENIRLRFALNTMKAALPRGPDEMAMGDHARKWLIDLIDEALLEPSKETL